MSERGDGYRRQADEADESARNTADDGVRKHFEELALHFSHLANTIEGGGLLIDFHLPVVSH